MKCYAGIGSRDINKIEFAQIKKIADILSRKGYVLYSGNANGSDIAFQQGSNGKCVLMLPWSGYNDEKYKVTHSLDNFDLGSTDKGRIATQKFHPNSKFLPQGVNKMMGRNYHQINGVDGTIYGLVNFVICCATTNSKKDGVEGGTGQAVRIAVSQKIPIINIRDDGWQTALKNVIS